MKPFSLYLYELGTDIHVDTVKYPGRKNIEATLLNWLEHNSRQGISYTTDLNDTRFDYIVPVDISWR